MLCYVYSLPFRFAFCSLFHLLVSFVHSMAQQREDNIREEKQANISNWTCHEWDSKRETVGYVKVAVFYQL